MGQLTSNILKSLKLRYKKESSATILGLDAAGKTTMLNKLKYGSVCDSIPTIGYNVELLKINGVDLTVWDLGGQEKLRALWGTYTEFTAGIIFVVDYLDTARYPDAKKALWSILDIPGNENKPILIIANKIDDEIKDEDTWNRMRRLLIDSLDLERKSPKIYEIWQASGLNADVSGTGKGDERLIKSLSWLADKLTSNK